MQAELSLSLYDKIAAELSDRFPHENTLVPLMAVFVHIYLITAVIAKNKAWLSILLFLDGGYVPLYDDPHAAPLDASLVHILGCAVGGILLGIGFGAISNQISKRPV